jgi:hypothetical protein
MFDNIINLNNYFTIKEHFGLFSAGDTTNVGSSVGVKKSFENNQKINRSMLVDSVTKLVNNVSSDVVQKNSSSAASAVGSSNILSIANIQCDYVEISDVRQDAQAVNQTSVTSSQMNMSKISNDISSTIDKTIEKVGGTDLAGLEAENTKQLNDYMKAMPGYDPAAALKLAAEGCPGSSSFLSVGNTCNVKTSYDLDGSVKKALDLDESFKINDTDDISNDIKTKLEQTNFASCQAAAAASNIIDARNIQCGVMSAINKTKKAEAAANRADEDDPDEPKRPPKGLIITDIEQRAIAKLYMTCVFNQENKSEIANKIVTKIGKKYNQIYDAIEKKGAEKGKAWMDEKMKLADLLSAAGAEKIIAAAGNLPKAATTPAASTAPKTTPAATPAATPTIAPLKPIDADEDRLNKAQPKPTTTPTQAKPGTPTTTGATTSEPIDDYTNIYIIAGVGVSVVVLFIAIFLILRRRRNN